jgi:fructokinase
MRRQKTIVGAGEILWDLYPGEKVLGGAPANAALHCHRLGEKGVVVSAVGMDVLGDEVIRYLEANGLTTQTIQRHSEKPTGTVGITLTEKGVPHFSCSHDTAFDYLEWTEELGTLVRHSDALIVGTLAQRNAVSRKTIQHLLSISTKAVKVFDVNFREWSKTIAQIVEETLHHTDILKLNDRELGVIQKSFGRKSDDKKTFLNRLKERYELKLIALSLGEKGCFFSDGTEQVFSPGYRVKVVDTTGCGDAFVAGLTIRYMEKASLEAIAGFANMMGGFLATRKGATPAFSEEDLARFQEVHPDRYDISMLRKCLR